MLIATGHSTLEAAAGEDRQVEIQPNRRMNHRPNADKYYVKSKNCGNNNVSGKPNDFDHDSEPQTQLETESGRGEDRACRINTTVTGNNIVIGAATAAVGQEHDRREQDSTHFQISNPTMPAIVSDSAKKTLDCNSRAYKEQNEEAQLMYNQTKGNAGVSALRFGAEHASLEAQRYHFDKTNNCCNIINSRADADIGHGFDQNRFDDRTGHCDAFLQSAAQHQTSRSDLENIAANDGSQGSEFLNSAGRVVENAHCFALGEQQHSRNQQANIFSNHSNRDNSAGDMKYSNGPHQMENEQAKSASFPRSSPDTTKFALKNSAHNNNNMNLPYAYRQDSSTGPLVRHQPNSLELDIVLPSKTSCHSRAIGQSMAIDSNQSLATSFNSNNNLLCESSRNPSISNANFLMGLTKAHPRDDFQHAPSESSIQFSSISENSTPEGGPLLGHNPHLFAGCPSFVAPINNNNNTPGIDVNISNNIMATGNDNNSICRQNIANNLCVNSSPVPMRQMSSTGGGRVAICTGVGSLEPRSMAECENKFFDFTRTTQRHHSLFVSMISLLENDSVMEEALKLLDMKNYRNLDSSSCSAASSISSNSVGLFDTDRELIKADKSENSAVKCAVSLSTSHISANLDEQMTTTTEREDISGLMDKGSAIVDATCSKHPSCKADNSNFLNNPSFVPINVPLAANFSSEACSQTINSNLGGSSIPSGVVPYQQSAKINLENSLKFIKGLKKSFSSDRAHILNDCIDDLEHYAAGDFLPDSIQGINNQSKLIGKKMEQKMMDLILKNLKLLIEHGFTYNIINAAIGLIMVHNEQMDSMYATGDHSNGFQFFHKDDQSAYNSIEGRNRKTRLTFSNAFSLLDSNRCQTLASSSRETKTLFSNRKLHMPSRVQSMGALAKNPGYLKYGGDQQYPYNNTALYSAASCSLGNNPISNISTSSMLNPLGIVGSERACDVRNNSEISKEANSVRKITRRFMPFPPDVVAKLNKGLNDYQYYPTADQRRKLADNCGITFSQVTSWFSNRRSRKKRKEGKNFDMDSSCSALRGRQETNLPSSISMIERNASGVGRSVDDLSNPQLQSTAVDEATSALESSHQIINVDTTNSTEGGMRSGSTQYSENYYGMNNLSSAASAEKNAILFESALCSHEG